jgi:dipeptidyl aminopeptidase/acylaminoacyl peptidase
MRRLIMAACAATCLASPLRAAPADGELVAERPCVRPAVSYDAYVSAQVKGYQDETELAARAHVRVRPAADYAKALPSRAEYEAHQAWPSACRRILYGSDGLKVSGFIWEPHERPAAAKLPVVVALRGGNQEFGKWGPNARSGMAALTDAGFIIIGVQYRGVDGGEGREEFGGADVHDVLAAVALARRLPEADGRNVFLEGTSRGGMEAMLALGAGAQVNAAALISPWTDLELEARLRPAVAAEVWAKLIPNYAANPVAARESRSGVRIAQTKDLPPLLLMHGTADWRADPANSTEVAEALKARGRPYALKIFEGDVHGLGWNWRERDRLEIAWFKSHMR